MPDNLTGIIGATVGIGRYVVNDYTITLTAAEDGNGYTMTITRGSETQTVTLNGVTPEAYAQIQEMLSLASDAVAQLDALGLSVENGAICVTFEEEE